jgi:predicted AAA+ superfamily ATPase
MEQGIQLHRRRLRPVIDELLAETPVLLLEGPRSVGKSTELRAVAHRRSGTILDLDNDDVLHMTVDDPLAAIRSEAPVCVDEYQRAPAVLQAIKALFNQRGTEPGQFLLAGSTRHAALPTGTQALTGRLSRLTILPLAQSEIDGTAPDLVSRMFTDPTSIADGSGSPTTREDYVARVLRGGFPLALDATSDGARSRWFDDYVSLTLDRDVRELSRTRTGWVLEDMLPRLAAQTGEILNVASTASDLDVSETTAREYARLLENSFLFQRLRPWGRTVTKRSVNRPKIHMVDSGVAGHLLRLTPAKLATMEPDRVTQFGHLLETFVLGELQKEASWTPGVKVVGYWHTRDGDEVDVVLERDDGSVVGIEVKASTRYRPKDYAGLRKLRDRVGDAFVAGVLMNTGPMAVNLKEERLHVVPIDRLWQPAR